MEINEESINAYKTIIENPQDYGFSFKPLGECFNEANDDPTPKHILFKEYVDYIQKPLPKVFFYLIMDRLYPQGKASSGHFGYKVKLKKELYVNKS